MHAWHLRDRILTIDKQALVLGIVNVTPDSFSDGGQFLDHEAAIRHALELARQGADLLDVGGESTRPQATPVPLGEELRRVVPVVERLVRETDVPISVDTSKAEVARACLAAGAQVVNDVTALSGDPDMLAVVRTSGAAVILMHMQGTPATMQQAPHYDDVVHDIARFFQEKVKEVVAGGLALENIALDPGIGFGKTQDHNLELLVRLREFQALGRPLCLGVSRKGLIGKILGRPLEQRLAGSLAIACHAVLGGAAQILRVHDVAETRDAVRMCATLHSGKTLS